MVAGRAEKESEIGVENYTKVVSLKRNKHGGITNSDREGGF